MAKPSNFFEDCTKVFFSLLPTVICLFDDIPFLLLNTSNIGPFLLVGAGFIVFIKEAIEGVLELMEAIELKETDEGRNSLIAIHTAKIISACIGFAVTTILLATTLSAMFFLASIAAIGIPAMVTIIAATELAEKAHGLFYAEGEKAEEKAKRKVFFKALALGFGIAITTLATLSVVSGLGVISLGIIPSAILIGVVATSLLIKIFELVDKKYDYFMTDPIKKAFNSFFYGEINVPKKKMENELLLSTTDTKIYTVLTEAGVPVEFVMVEAPKPKPILHAQPELPRSTSYIELEFDPPNESLDESGNSIIELEFDRANESSDESSKVNGYYTARSF